MRSWQQSRVQSGVRRTLTTIGAACRAVQTETVGRMITGMVDTLTVEHWSITDMQAVLAYSWAPL